MKPHDPKRGLRTPADRLDAVMRGRSNTEVARAAKVYRHTLQRWREKIGYADGLARLSETLGVSLDWLLAGREPVWLPGRSLNDELKQLDGEVGDA